MIAADEVIASVLLVRIPKSRVGEHRSMPGNRAPDSERHINKPRAYTSDVILLHV